MKKLRDAFFATAETDIKHIGVLDGVRAFSVMLVCGFHFWQQSWLWNLYKSDILQKIGIADCGMNWIFSTGYVWVDMMILLTGLCLFLPYADMMTDGIEELADAFKGAKRRKLPSVGKFYVKRVARIFPSYYLCIAVFAAFFVRVADYGSKEGYLRDLISHLTFTHMAERPTYLYTKFNGVLWTVGVEMAFYVIFPLLAYLFTKAPIATWLGMNGCSLVYYLAVIVKKQDDLSFYINQFPTFLCVFANGMMAALVIAALAKRLRQNKFTGLFFTFLALFSLYFIRLTVKYGLAQSSTGQFWQVQNRFGLSLLFVAFIIGASFSFNWFRFIFSNKVTRYLAAISFNLYIWHQVVAVKLKEWKIPDYVSESGMPQKDAGRAWQWKYTVVIWIVSILLATLITYLWEKPLHKLIMKAYDKAAAGIAARKEARKNLSEGAQVDVKVGENVDEQAGTAETPTEAGTTAEQSDADKSEYIEEIIDEEPSVEDESM
ncbi:MAG: acyltransferase [Clostridia bacterium]|nr:acyltransferase [Clostridia bacterium]